MREILFRGKCVDSGEWVYGNFIEDKWGDDNGNTIYAILQDRVAPGIVELWTPVRVIPETVGEYTGLKDKNGKKIFEGDIVRLHYFYEAVDPTTLGRYEAEQTIIATIRIWNMGVGFDPVGDDIGGYLCDWIDSPQDELDIIGNIHDNPELLEMNK